MKSSRDPWLKVVFAAMLSLAAAQVFTFSAAAAESDEPDAAAKTEYWIGVGCAELPDVLKAQLDLPDGQGVLVDEVVADSPAERAGLKAYDVIFAVDGKAVGDPQAIAAAVRQAGDHDVKLEFLRAGRKETLSVKPGPRPKSIGPQQQDQRSIRQWVERLGRGPEAMHFKFFHPGMVLPPGVSIAPSLPDDMTVTIEKHGDKPAKVRAKQGDQEWETNEDALDKLPEDARRFAERMLGFGAFASLPFQPVPRGAAMPPAAWPPTHADARVNKRLDEMQRQIDELRKSVEEPRARISK
jgi:membrane-associated protease RseP (regulator of RpoE activity)